MVACIPLPLFVSAPGDRVGGVAPVPPPTLPRDHPHLKTVSLLFYRVVDTIMKWQQTAAGTAVSQVDEYILYIEPRGRSIRHFVVERLN